jgi:glycosyltransferase involved in cell wall biosynthesis
LSDLLVKTYTQSIVIPTRNRAETAIYAVESCLRVAYESKQIVVVDNSDDDSLRHLLADAGWLDKVDYHKNKVVLSMRDNWEKGLELADGELVSVMGDDDAILGASMDIANFAFNRANIDVLNGGSAIYKWPSYPFQGRRNYLSFEFGEEIKILKDPRSMLKGAYQYELTMGTGPGVYYGFVKKEFQNRLKKLRGKYLIDKIPDFDSGYCTLLYADAYALSKRPLFIQGHSGKSNSGAMRYAASQKTNMEVFATESDEPLDGIFTGALSDVRSNSAVIVSAQLRFQAEVEKVLGQGAVSLDREKAWHYILKGLSEGYDVIEFIASIPALRRLAKEWSVPYTLSDKFEPFVGDSSLIHEQGFLKSNPLTEDEGAAKSVNGYGSVVVNGATIGFENILDAVRHVDAMLPTMSASPDVEVSEASKNQTKKTMLQVLENARACIADGLYDEAMRLLDLILSAGEIGLVVDDEVAFLAEKISAHEWGSRYFARRFSGCGEPKVLEKLINQYEKMGANELIASFRAGMSQVHLERFSMVLTRLNDEGS